MMKIIKKTISVLVSIALILGLFPNWGGIREVKAASAGDVTSLAASQIGYHEKASLDNLDDFKANSGSGNYTKYHRDLGARQGDEWCAYFVWWVYQTAGVPLDQFPRSGYAPTCKNWFNQRSRYYSRGSYIPQPGDSIFFDWDYNGVPNHVAIVEFTNGNNVHFIEGNNSSNSVGYREFSMSNSMIMGYGKMNLSGNKDPQGCFDLVECRSNGTIWVRGWAFDPDEPNKSISVHVYVGGYAGSTDYECHPINADKERTDVNNAYGISGKHGFDETIPVKRSGNQPVYIYAINSTSGNNPQIGEKTVTISKDTEPPKISNVEIKNITPNGYDVSCEVSDNVAIDRVEFPTWTVNNDQDDLIWHRATIKDGIATYHVNRKDHNNEFGEYKTHIYVYDVAGNYAFAGNGSTDSTDGSKTMIVTLEEGKSPQSGTFNNHEYIVYNDSITATQARHKEIDGYHLATITSEDEYNYIMSLIGNISYPSEGYWLGANDNQYEGTFMWETGEPFIYSNWPAGQPDNKDTSTGNPENYFGLWSSGIWNDFTESYKLGYVLEKDPPISVASGTYNEHEYYVSSEYMIRSYAETLQKDGWYLATITSKEERDYVLSLINNLSEKNLRGYWLGGNDVAKEGTFVWETGEPFDYVDWESGEPTNRNQLGLNENHLVLYNSGKFNDSNETYCHGYILERDPESRVIKVDSINITSNRDETKDAYEEDTFKLTASILPENATNKTVSWKSSDEEYATVDADGNVSVLATIPNAIKTITITASNEDNTISADYSFVVCPKSSCEHDWGEGRVIKDSTCSEYGEKEFTCSKCNTTKIETIELKEHSAVKDNAVPASCNSTGLTEGSHCSICKKVLVAQSVISRLDHEYDDGVVTKEPTTTSTGIKVFTCKLCGSSYETEIPKLYKENNDEKAIDSVSLDQTNVSMNKGDLYSLNAQILPEDIDNKGINWSSSNIQVAMVNSDGAVAALSKGRITITATSQYDTTKKASCVVTVWDKYEKPHAPIHKVSTIDSIEMEEENGCEYSLNGYDWQSSNIFTDLAENTEYTVYMRRVENYSEYYLASDASEGTVVKTASKKNESEEQKTDNKDKDNKPTEQDKPSDQNQTDQTKPNQDAQKPVTQQKDTQTQKSSEEKSTEEDKTKNIDGVGTISSDGKILTDSTGEKYRVSEKITSKQLKANLKVADKKAGGKFKIIKVTKKSGKVTGGTVIYMAPYNKKCTKASVPNAIKIAGVKFTVTELRSNAFKKCTKLTRVDIGTNVTKIGTNAFRSCTKLKTINIKSTKLKSIGSKAFTNINKTAKIKVPKKMNEKYSRMIRKADAPKNVNIE